jgi:hypothetical protein
VPAVFIFGAAKFTHVRAAKVGQSSEVAEIVERGDVLFFYRPTVQPADAVEVELGVQAFYVVLSPAGTRSHRRVRIGKKRMPAPAMNDGEERRKAERFWARVERVGSFERVMGDQLADEVYTTKTRGERYQPGARPVAQGCYALVRHTDHVHFVYRVDREEDAPEAVRVPAVGDSVLLFERAPSRDSNAIWTAEGDVRRLDQEGEELVFVGVDDDPEEVLGLGLELL